MQLRVGFVLILWVGTSYADHRIELGDGQITGMDLQPYGINWHQCVKQEDAWVNQGVLHEELTPIGANILRQRQTAHRPDGIVTVATTFFDRKSFAPVRMEMRVTGADGNAMITAFRALNEIGYVGEMERGGESRQLKGNITSQMFHGGALGLPLVSVGRQDHPVKFEASMMSFDATYDVIATWSGTDTVKYGDKDVEAVLVDVKWHHRESGDVYPPGPNASGGRYWLVSDPPPGFPYVPRYQTDTYVVEFEPRTCAKD